MYLEYLLTYISGENPGKILRRKKEQQLCRQSGMTELLKTQS
jgi:hypothetical protein